MAKRQNLVLDPSETSGDMHNFIIKIFAITAISWPPPFDLVTFSLWVVTLVHRCTLKNFQYKCVIKCSQRWGLYFYYVACMGTNTHVVLKARYTVSPLVKRKLSEWQQLIHS